MRLRSHILVLLILASAIQQGFTADGKTFEASTGQTAEEIEDIGVIEGMSAGAALRSKFRFNVSGRGQYTSNALLTGNHGSGDFLFLPTLEAGFHTSLGQHFSFDLLTRVESVIYSRHDDHGFAGYSAVATLDYRIKAGLPRFYVSVEPYRYDSFDTGELLTQAIGFAGGTDWGYAFNRGRSLAYAGYSFTDYISDPNIDSRCAHRAVIGLAHQLRLRLTGQVYYAYQYSDFNEIDRSDSRHVIAGALVYQFSDHLFGNLSTNFVDNDSKESRASYQGFGASLGVSLQF